MFYTSKAQATCSICSSPGLTIKIEAYRERCGGGPASVGFDFLFAACVDCWVSISEALEAMEHGAGSPPPAGMVLQLPPEDPASTATMIIPLPEAR